MGNDGAATGGFNTWEVALASNGTFPNPTVHKTGRTKLVNVVYSNAGKTGLPSPNPTLTCDFSMWRHNQSSRLYVQRSGETTVLCAGGERRVVLSISTFSARRLSGPMSCEMRTTVSMCLRCVLVILLEIHRKTDSPLLRSSLRESRSRPKAVQSLKVLALLFASGDGMVCAFTAAESTEHPSLEVLFSTNEKVAGLTTYYDLHEEYLLVIFPDLINIYDCSYKLVEQIEISGVDDYKLNDAAIY